MAGVRVQVRREALLAKVRERADQCEKDYQQAVKEYEHLKQRWPKTLAAALKEIAKDITDHPGEYDSIRKAETAIYKRVENKVPHSRPRKPTGAKRLIELLEMGAAEKMTVSEETYKEYMETCRR